jgi:hypothetical protein
MITYNGFYCFILIEEGGAANTLFFTHFIFTGWKKSLIVARHKILRPCKCLQPELIKKVKWVTIKTM